MLNSETQLNQNDTKATNHRDEESQQQAESQQQPQRHQQLSQQNQLKNPLNEHDYCSPNKMIVKRNVLTDGIGQVAGNPSTNTTKSINTPSAATTPVNKIKKERQPRQPSISVTDKSQWITGDEEIETALSEHLTNKVQRERRANSGVKEPDPDFSHYTSSEYSVSDEESDEQESDDDYNSEDDPDRLWCTCRKPHDNKFMICCDVCKDWFHGHCVGVTHMMASRFEKQGKEWFCGECLHKIKSGIPRDAIPKKINPREKKKRNKSSSSGGRGRGRPKKSDSSIREGATRMLRSSRKSTSSLDPKLGVDNGRLRKNLSRSDVRSESFDEFQDSQKLKELIKERKKAFFYKRQLAAQQKAARRSELGLGNKLSVTSNLSDSLDSLATSTSTPNMNNLPINIKERSEPNIVLQINIKKDPGSDQNSSNSRIVTTIVRSPKKLKHVDSINPIVNDLFTADPIQINKKVVKTPTTTSITSSTIIGSSSTSSTNAHIGTTNTLTGGDLTNISSTSTNINVNNNNNNNNNSSSSNNNNNNNNNGDTSVRKRSNSSNSNIKKEKHKSNDNNSAEHEGPTPKKKRKDSESSIPNGSVTPVGSQHFVKKIKETLELRCKQINNLEISTDKIEKIATEIESSLNESFREGSTKYKNKYASIIFNLKDPKNQGLARNVLTETISPSKLVNMSPDELASSELAKWRERENKHSIELIKRDAELAAQQVIVKKTHKGEEIISASLPNESEDVSAKVDSQETPTTPNKLSTNTNTKDVLRVDSSKIILAPPVIKPPTIEPIDYDLDDHKNEGKHEYQDEDEIHPLDRSPNAKSPIIKESPSHHLTSTHYLSTGEKCWSGTITMPDIVELSAFAKSISGPIDIEQGGIESNLMVCGRISPDQVQSYIKKLKSTTKNPISIIQLFPMTDNNRDDFNELCDYLYKRNRYGVIQTNPQILKDFYIIPISDNGSIPEVLKSTVKGQAIDRKEANCLIGLLVKNKKPTSTTATASSSSSDPVYTPTPIN